MRVAHGVPRIASTGNTAPLEDVKKRTGSGSPAAGPRDTVQISSEARDLHTGGAPKARTDSDVDRAEDARMVRIRERIGSGFYDARNARLAVAEKILSLFGL